MGTDNYSTQELKTKISAYPAMMQSTIESLAVAILNKEIPGEPKYNCDMQSFSDLYSAAVSVSRSLSEE